MNAVANRVPSAARTASRQSLGGVGATLIADAPVTEFLPHNFGRLMIQVHSDLCAPDIRSGDVISVDFDRRTFAGDSFYLVEIDDAPAGQPAFSQHWLGARQLQRTPAGLHVREYDQAGIAAWMLMTPAMVNRYRSCGEVLEIFKSTSRKGASL